MDTEDAEIGNFVFNDNKHQDSMLQALNMMRKNKHFCDVILHVGNTEIHAHRCVLASASPYLLELFTTDQENSRKSENILTYKLNDAFDKFSLKRLVEYAYTSKLEVPQIQVKAVYLAACQLKMERVVVECIRHLIETLSIDNCIEIRSLPGIAKNRKFVAQVDRFISDNFDSLRSDKVLLSLNCVQVEILSQTRVEMSFSCCPSLCQLVLDWMKRQWVGEETSYIYEKMHMLYLAMDNSLQDCTDLPQEDVSNTEIVKDYKKLSLKTQPNQLNINKRKCLGQPSKPRVLIYQNNTSTSTNTQEEQHQQQLFDKDWNLIASSTVAEHTFLALVTLNGNLTTLSLQLRLNPPTAVPLPIINGSGVLTPPECNTSPPSLASTNNNSINNSGTNTPPSSGSTSDSDCGDEQEPDLYCAVQPMPNPKCAFGCIAFNNVLIVCGGYDRVECLNNVEVYVPTTNTWLSLCGMRENRGRFEIAIVNNVIYALGGSNGHTELNTMEYLDLTLPLLKWRKLDVPMPLASSNHGVCVFNDCIYLIGGWNGQAGIKQCHTFHPNEKIWKLCAPLNTGRHQAGVVAYNNLIYVIGGTDNWNCLNSVEVYDPEQNTWTYTKPLNTQRRGCRACVFNNQLYVVGGSDGTTSLNSTEIYDETIGAWIQGPPMTQTRNNVGVVVVDNRLYAIGGFSGKSFLSSIEYLDLNSNQWTTFIPTTKTEPQQQIEYNYFINQLQQQQQLISKKTEDILIT